jgi:hypothetical protein
MNEWMMYERMKEERKGKKNSNKARKQAKEK